MTAEKFEDFCVAGKELFLVQNNSHKVYTLLNWEEYGLRITIPHEAVPLYDTVEVAITALVGGEFILPEDTELVSAVYAISVSKQFLKPVQLEIQHCVSIENPAHSNYLSFATVPSDEASCEFQPVKGAGEFSVRSRYGSIYITEFSRWSIIKKVRRRIRRFLPSSSITPPCTEPAPPSTPSQRTQQSSPSSSSSSTIHPSPSPSSVASTIPPSPSAPSLGEDTDGSMGSTTNAAANEVTTASTESPSSSDNSSLEGMYMHTIVQYIYIRICIDQAPFNCYYGQVVYDVKRPGREWLMRFLTSKDLDAMVKV